MLLYCYGYIILKNYKQIKYLKFYDIIICFILCCIPYITYMIDNYIQTNSIIFPYYNKIFHSEYFANYNWVDFRFGIHGIINKIFWPIIVSCFIYRYGDDNPFYDPIWAVGYIFIIVFIIYNLRKKNKNLIFSVSVISLIYTIVWITILQGYMRYGGVIAVLYAVSIIAFIISKLKIRDIENTFLKNEIFIVCIIFNICIGCIYINNEMDFNNLIYLFKDKEKYEIHIDGVWGAPKDCCAFASLIREKNTPIYSLQKEYFKDNEKTLKMWYEKISSNDIYVIIDYYGGSWNENLRVKSLKESNFEIYDIVDCYTVDEIPYINANSVWYLVKVKYIGE